MRLPPRRRPAKALPYLLDVLPSTDGSAFIGEVDLGKCIAMGKTGTVLAGRENYLGSHQLH